MSGCGAFRESLSACLDGALAPGEAAALEAHLAQCPACRQALKDLRNTVARVRALEPVEPPPGMAERILARTAQPRRRPLPFAAHPQLRAAALVLVCLTGLLMVKVAGPRKGLVPPLPSPAPPPPSPPPPASSGSPATRQVAPTPPPPAPSAPLPKPPPPPPPSTPLAMPLAPPAIRDDGRMELSAPPLPQGFSMNKASGADRRVAKEEARLDQEVPLEVVLELDLRIPGDPSAAVAAALEQSGATQVLRRERSATARLESRRLPALLVRLDRTARVRGPLPPNLPAEIQVTISW